MQISNTDWNRYVERLSKVNKTAAKKMQEYIQKYGTENTEELIRYAYGIVEKYSEAASAAACDMFEAIAEAENVMVPEAVPAEHASYGEVAKTVNGTVKYNNTTTLENAIARLVKRSAADTMLMNAERNGAQFAWIPHGDTCAFCITLASRGWQYMSKKALKNGHAEHIHANCDCQYAIRFDNKTNVQGYDPDKYLEMYNGDNPNAKPAEKIKILRRAITEQNRQIKVDVKDEISRKRNTLITANKVQESKYNVYISENASHKKQNLDNIEKGIESALEKLNADNNEGINRIIVVSQEEMGNGALASYNAINNEFYLSDLLGNKKETIRLQTEFGFADEKSYDSTIRHEIIHWMDAEDYKKTRPITNIDEYRLYLQELREKCKMSLDELGITEENISEISEYASSQYFAGMYDEAYTEYRVKKGVL